MARVTRLNVNGKNLSVDVDSTMSLLSVFPFDLGTFGSLTTPLMATQLRKAAAAHLKNQIEGCITQAWVAHYSKRLILRMAGF